MTDREKMKEIEGHLSRLQKAYVDDFMEVTQQKGYDEYSDKWKKKLNAVARKYAKFMVPLTEEYNELCDKVNAQLEEERKKKFVEPE